MDTGGTPNTCYFEDFLRQGGTNTAPPDYHPDGIAICHSCKCETARSLSFGQGTTFCEGPDIVDIEGTGANYDVASYASFDANDAACPVDANLSIRREEFPADLFAFLFGQRAWLDVNDGGGSPCARDALECHFNEQRIVEECKFPRPGSPTEIITANLPADTCYLLNIKNRIHIGDGIADEAECNALGQDTSGLVWVHSQQIVAGSITLPGYAEGCTRIRGLDDDSFGTPANPVALVYDGSLTQVNGLVMYGLLFLREPNGNTALNATTYS